MLRITNAGPYSGKRKLDVSRAAADKLGFRKQGVAALVITVLQSPTKAEASYVRRRVYPKVPGHLGKFANVDIALEAAQARFNVREAPSSSSKARGYTWRLPRSRLDRFRGHSPPYRHRSPARW